MLNYLIFWTAGAAKMFSFYSYLDFDILKLINIYRLAAAAPVILYTIPLNLFFIFCNSPPEELPSFFCLKRRGNILLSVLNDNECRCILRASNAFVKKDGNF